MKWYFDTWAPLDGIAFASRRAEGASTREQTIALVPPYWRPRAVSAATAMRAERGGLQVAFYDQNQQQIGFDLLDELIAVVRQAYLSGGYGPPPDFDVAKGAPPNGPSLGAPMMTILQEKDAGQRFARFRAVVSWVQFADSFRLACDTVARMAVDIIQQQHLERRVDAEDWIALLLLIGYHSALPRAPLPWYPSHLGWWRPSGERAADVMARGLLFRWPYPFQGSSFLTLGEQLFGALAARQYMEKLTDHAQVVTLLLAASAVVAATGAARYDESDASLEKLVSLALTWLARGLPTVPSATPAGKALEELVHKRIA